MSHLPRPRRLRRMVTVLAAVGLATSLATTPVAARPTAPAAASTGCADYPFRNPKLGMSARIDDLLGRLTLTEKISLLHQYEQPIPRLCIGLFKAGTEALHGFAWSNDYYDNGNVVTATATTFPQAVGLASTWDPALLRKVGSAVGDEARGLHAQNPNVWGLNLWAPVVNLLRDPRWGRNEEGYSEDPTLTSAIATAYGLGMESPQGPYLKSAPTLKHFLAYDNEVRRDTTSSELPPRVQHEYDEQAFEPALRANAATGVMASYNLVNGRPNTVSSLLNGLRSQSKYPLFNVSDAFAPYNLTGSQQYYPTQPAADAAMFKAGIDAYVADNNDPSVMIADVKAALDQGLLTVADVERVDRHALSLRFRLGEFDPDGGPYGRLAVSAVNTPAHQALARRTADEAAVLLKNDGHALPLDPSTDKSVAVIGPLEDTVYSDWYGGNPPYRVTALDGIRGRLGAGGAVTGTEGVDRIALRDVATGKYVTSTGTGTADAVTASAAAAGAGAQFDVFDWGQDVVTLRNVGTGNVLGYDWGPFVTHDKQPNGWYVQQQFKLEKQDDGTYVLHYAGYETQESWFGDKTYVTIDPTTGRLTLGAASAAAAAHFTKDVLVDGVQQAVDAAKQAHTAVLVLGTMPFINGREAHDRTSMDLAAGQERLAKAVLAANPNTVLVLQSSYPQTITWEQQHVPAIVWTTHAGQETGHAIADVLFGDTNPSGRLTQTWYESADDLPSILDYDIAKAGTTYLYHHGPVLYPFGYGLSYTTFRYGDLRVGPPAVGAGGTIAASVRVTNTGARAGTEVVQLYTHQRTSRDPQPIEKLQSFRRVRLAAGASTVVRFRLPAAALAHWDVTRSRWVVERSRYDVLVGSSADDIRQSGSVYVRGEVIPARDLTRTTRAENFDDYAGVQLVDESKAAGTALGATADGQWAKYADAALARPRTFTARVANPGAAAGSVEVRLDSPDGRLLGTASAPATGSAYDYVTVPAPLAAAAGRHDVYLVLTNGLRLATFRLR